MSLNDLLDKLGLTHHQNLYRTIEVKGEKPNLPFRIQKSLDLIKPTAFFCFNNEPLVLFFENPGKEYEKLIHRRLWNFNRAPLVFVIDDFNITVYNAFRFSSEKEKKRLQTLDSFDLLCLTAEIEKYSVWNLVSGKYWKTGKKNFKSKSRIDWYLLKNIEEAFQLLKEDGLPQKTANKIIGFFIFARYLVDRKVKLDEKFINNHSVKDARQSLLNIVRDPAGLIKFYHYLKDAFNGDLFELSGKELKEITPGHCRTLHLLFQGGEVLKRQPSLFDIYDFAIIPIELIGNIYEMFIGQEKQAKNKAFYTPPFLVDYVLDKTVKKQLGASTSSDCRVLDPACGSGIFLVETFRLLVEKARALKGQKLSAAELENVLIDNIYGIDKDEDALDIAVFSLYITLLDYKEPREIADYKFPHLKYKKNSPGAGRGKNFFEIDFLDCENRVFDSLEEIPFDFIIGNPPWGSVTSKENQNYVKKCKNEGLIISDYQVAQSFLVRVKDFAVEGTTKIGLIVSAKILYNDKARSFREYFLDHFKLTGIFNLSAVRRTIFESATGPGAVLFYETGGDMKNEIEHISLLPNLYLGLFNSLVIEKQGRKVIKQSVLRGMDWLWKPLLYGNSLDFYFIKRLIDSHGSFADFIENEKLIMGEGFIRGNKIKKRENLANFDYLPTEMLLASVSDYKMEKVEDKYPDLRFKDAGVEAVYKAPHLIIKRSINRRPVVTFMPRSCAFANTLYGISGDAISATSESLLKAVGALLNSGLIIYYLFLIAGEWGVYYDEIHKDDFLKIRLPAFDASDVERLADLFSKLQDKCNGLLTKWDLFGKKTTTNLGLKKMKEEKNEVFPRLAGEELKTIDELVNKIYDVSEIEQDLIDYALNISVPLFKNDPKPLRSPGIEDLKKYAGIYVDYFKDWYKGPDDFFKVEIFRTDFFTWMNFKIVPEPPIEPIEEPGDGNGDNLKQVIELLGKFISLEMITGELFIQNDIKGFEEDSFYVIKPNEYKNWHPAVARLDVLEFAGVILKQDTSAGEVGE